MDGRGPPPLGGGGYVPGGGGGAMYGPGADGKVRCAVTLISEDIRGIWPMLGEGYIAGKREHEERRGSF